MIPSVEELQTLRWTQKKANRWYVERPWIVGANFVYLAISSRAGIKTIPVLFDSVWDPFPETGEQKAPQVYRLLPLTYLWARESRPEQPLTAGVWINDWTPESSDLFVRLQIDASDFISFHAYADRSGTERRIKELLPYGRPLVCTEYMARTTGSTFQEIMPLFREYGVGAIN